MEKAGRLAGVAGGFALFLLAGCNSVNFAGLLSFQSDNSGRDRVVTASLDAVTQSTQSTLSQLGFTANVARSGETVKISSKTATGAKFAVVLTREKTKDGEQTRMHLEWEGASEDQTGFQILGQVEAMHKR
jgi:hypothetical protein